MSSYRPRARESFEPDYDHASHYEGEFGRGAARSALDGRRDDRVASPGRYSGRGPKGYQRSDERLKEEVCDRLTIDPDIDASEIGVSVQSGEVSLEGSVRTRQMKRDAEDCVEAIPGVQQVHNRIRVETDSAH